MQPFQLKTLSNADYQATHDAMLARTLERIEQKNALNGYETLLQKYFSLNLEDFIFEYNGSIYEFDRLMSFARIIKYNVGKNR